MEGGRGIKKWLKEGLKKKKPQRGGKSHYRNIDYLQNSVITSVIYCHNIYTHQL